MFFCRWFCLGCLALFFTGQLSATTLESLSLDALVDHADLIVQVEIGESGTAFFDDQPHTLVEAAVEEVLKGAPISSITVAIPGGVIRPAAIPIEVEVVGAPQLFQGNRAILFLEEFPGYGSLYRIVGFSQGVFLFTTDGTNAVQDLRGLAAGDTMSVAALKAEIRSTTEVAR